jgi:LPS sulfotransferase NodH
LPPTPLARVLASQGVVLPERPLDLSAGIAVLGLARAYAIVMTGRCGSTWLATALEQIEGCGAPHEYFAEDAILSYARPAPGAGWGEVALDLVARHARGGAFGFKINPTRLGWLAAILDIGASFAHPGLAYIDMRRWNIVAQAQSFLRAKRSGDWHRFRDGRRLPGTPAMPDLAAGDAAVWAEIEGILRQERQAEAYYAAAGIVPLRIWYEEIGAGGRHGLILRVGQHIGRPVALAEAQAVEDRTEKMAAAAEALEEDGFVERHAEALNAALARRAGAEGAGAA